jgi:ABC-2 type transport system ATP-binding protein
MRTITGRPSSAHGVYCGWSTSQACSETMRDHVAVIHDGIMIEVTNLTKRYGATTAVNNLSFTVQPGIVTGFLGPNGAGKSTTMRMILGLDRPTSGSATVNGRSLHEHAAPLGELGALLEAKAVHPKRSGRNHLRALAATSGISHQRVEEVLDIVGLTDVADRAAGGFSLGMSQRLGIASALLGDPSTVMLDEPVNGLDPEGVLWIRHLLKDLAAQGRTVLVSSHLMSEMAMTAEHFVIIGRGEMIVDVTATELDALAKESSVLVRAEDPERMRALLTRDGVTISSESREVFAVTGMDSTEIGRVAATNTIALSELTTRHSTLEQTFMDLTAGSVEYSANTITANTITANTINKDVA